jgi:S-formylglutathione hydrolase
MKVFKILAWLMLFISYQLESETLEGQLIEISIPSPSLENNLFEDLTENPIAIYLPPSYNTSDIRYPVVYYLPGFVTELEWLLHPQSGYGFQGFKLKESMDDLIAQGKMKEMIVVMTNGLNFMWGGFYVNSPVTGNWEDYVVNDLVDYIDGHYRTLDCDSSRGITGHSMGGFGALNIAMRNPDVFCATYGLCPGLFDTNGLSDMGMLSPQARVEQFLSKQEEWAAMDEEAAIEAIKGYIGSLKSEWDEITVISYAYGAAFSPNPEIHPPYIDYPYYKSGEQILCDSTLLQNYENGFGGLAWKVGQYKENLSNLKGIVIDYGSSDENPWIPRGCEYFSQILNDNAISHDLLSFSGGHDNRVRSRIENSIMPFFSEILTFDTLYNSIDLGNIPSDYILYNSPNPFNQSTTIFFETPEEMFITLEIYNNLGEKIETLVNEVHMAGKHRLGWNAKGLGSGIYLCKLKAGEYSKTRKIIFLK